MDWRAYLASLGINDAIAIAGFFGSIVNALRLKSPNPITVLSTVVSGTLIAIYIGRIIAEFLGVTKPEYVFGVAFIVGFLGYSALDLVISWGQKQVGKNGNSPTSNGGPRDAAVR